MRKKLRRPRLYYQDRELLWLGCTTCVNQRYLVRDFHSVRYPVRWTTENRSWSGSLQLYSCLTLNSEHLVGFRLDSYCAYSDTEVRVNYFELYIDCQLSKRGVIYLFHLRKRHISSKGKSDTSLISSLLLFRRHTLYGAKIVYVTYDDRPKLLYYTINLG